MAFETGTAATLEELIDTHLKSFMVAQGWTLNNDNYPDHLALSKGGCYANLRADSRSTTRSNLLNDGIQNFNDAFGVARTDRKIWAHLSSGYSATGGWAGQPDSPIDSTSIGEPFVQVNDLNGPFPSYSLFSGDETAGDEAYVYMVVETRAGHYSHLFFGNVDQGGLGYSPNAAFLTGSRVLWWPFTTDASNRGDLQWDSRDHRYPFSHFFEQTHIHGGGALPGEQVRPTTSNNRGPMPVVSVQQGAPLTNRDTQAWPNSDFFNNGMLLDSVPYRGQVAQSGVTPLSAIPIMASSIADANVYHFLGHVPNLRFCSLFGLTPGQQLTFGEDIWRVFPIRRQAPRGRMAGLEAASPALTNTTFQWGVAIKQVS